MENNTKNLYYLDELPDYKVADGDPDVRGWTVNDKDQLCIGTVDNLLVNKNTQRVVYLDVEVNPSIIDVNHAPYAKSASEGVHEFLNKDGDNHLIIPIGMVTLDKESKKIHTQEIDRQTFAQAPRTAKSEAILRVYELRLLATLNSTSENYPDGDALYNRHEFQPWRF